MGQFLTVTYTWARRCAIALIGGTVVLIGILMIVFPGPAFIVIPAGLAILGIEFACARRWLKKLRAAGTSVLGRTRFWRWPSRKASSADVPTTSASRSSERHSDFFVSSPASLARTSNASARANTKTSYYRVP